MRRFQLIGTLFDAVVIAFFMIATVLPVIGLGALTAVVFFVLAFLPLAVSLSLVGFATETAVALTAAVATIVGVYSAAIELQS